MSIHDWLHVLHDVYVIVSLWGVIKELIGLDLFRVTWQHLVIAGNVVHQECGKTSAYPIIVSLIFFVFSEFSKLLTVIVFNDPINLYFLWFLLERTTFHSPITPDSASIASSIKYHAEFTPLFSPEHFELPKAFFATAQSIRDALLINWNATNNYYENLNVKQAYYLSMEFLQVCWSLL